MATTVHRHWYQPEYPVTRPINLGRWYPTLVYFLGGCWVVIINIAAVGYEVIPVSLDSYNATSSQWYERFLPEFWRPKGTECESSIIHLNDGISILVSVKG